jgi:hypothetical protein
MSWFVRDGTRYEVVLDSPGSVGCASLAKTKILDSCTPLANESP